MQTEWKNIIFVLIALSSFTLGSNYADIIVPYMVSIIPKDGSIKKHGIHIE